MYDGNGDITTSDWRLHGREARRRRHRLALHRRRARATRRSTPSATSGSPSTSIPATTYFWRATWGGGFDLNIFEGGMTGNRDLRVRQGPRSHLRARPARRATSARRSAAPAPTTPRSWARRGASSTSPTPARPVRSRSAPPSSRTRPTTRASRTAAFASCRRFDVVSGHSPGAGSRKGAGAFFIGRQPARRRRRGRGRARGRRADPASSCAVSDRPSRRMNADRVWKVQAAAPARFARAAASRNRSSRSGARSSCHGERLLQVDRLLAASRAERPQRAHDRRRPVVPVGAPGHRGPRGRPEAGRRPGIGRACRSTPPARRRPRSSTRRRCVPAARCAGPAPRAVGRPRRRRPRTRGSDRSRSADRSSRAGSPSASARRTDARPSP